MTNEQRQYLDRHIARRRQWAARALWSATDGRRVGPAQSDLPAGTTERPPLTEPEPPVG